MWRICPCAALWLYGRLSTRPGKTAAQIREVTLERRSASLSHSWPVCCESAVRERSLGNPAPARVLPEALLTAPQVHRKQWVESLETEPRGQGRYLVWNGVD